MKIYKVVLLGNAFVGKSSLVMRTIHKKFEHFMESTIGAAFFTYIFPDDVKLEIWDTSGQERFNSLAKMYYRKASIALLVFDVNCKKSFLDIKKWIDELNKNEPDAMILVFANKCDLEFEVSREEYENYFKSLNLECITCSAKTGEGLEEMFSVLHQKLKQKPELELKREFIVTPEEPKSNGCC